MRVHLHASLRTRASLMLDGLGYCNCVKVSNSRLSKKFYSSFWSLIRNFPTPSSCSHLFTPLVILSINSPHTHTPLSSCSHLFTPLVILYIYLPSYHWFIVCFLTLMMYFCWVSTGQGFSVLATCSFTNVKWFLFVAVWFDLKRQFPCLVLPVSCPCVRQHSSFFLTIWLNWWTMPHSPSL